MTTTTNIGVSRPLRFALAKAKYEKAQDEIELAWLSFNEPIDQIADFYTRRHHARMRDMTLEGLRLKIRQHEVVIEDIDRRLCIDEMHLFIKRKQDKKEYQEALDRIAEREKVAQDTTL